LSYVPNNAQTGNQSVFSVKPSTTFVPVYGITSCKHSGKNNKTVEITTLQSTGTEFLPTMNEYGSFELTINRVSSDPGWQALQASWIAKNFLPYELVLPLTPAQTTTGDTYTFTGLVAQFDDITDIDSNKQIITSAKITVSGAWTFTAGS
jgi:hypothetical protein